MRQVTKDEFYRAIGNRDAAPQIQPGPYPYTSVFKLRFGGEVLGKVVGRLSGGLTVNDYFLPEKP